jgi:hypothetical protein
MRGELGEMRGLAGRVPIHLQRDRETERDVSHRHWEQLTTRIQNLTKLLVSWYCALVSSTSVLCGESIVAGMLDCGLMQSSPHSPGGCSQLEQEISMDWGG